MGGQHISQPNPTLIKIKKVRDEQNYQYVDKTSLFRTLMAWIFHIFTL